MKKIYLSFMLSLMAFVSFAQGWQYVGSPFINQSTGFSTFLYFPDLEFNASGDIFTGYWQSQANTLFFAKYDGVSWTKLPSPSSSSANYLDIEVKGNNYYMAYSSVRSGNMYVFVKQYNGATWTQLGDSLLLGNSGSGGWFDFVLDNNEVPTLLGTVNAVLLADKQMVQYTGGSWNVVYTFPGSAPTIFRENAGIFDAQNKLYCVTQGYVTAPTVTYYTIAHELNGGIRTAVGDTIFGPSSAHRMKIAGGSTYLLFNESIKSEVMAYQLNGNSWSFVADTAGSAIGIMLSGDVASNGKIVYHTQNTNLDRSFYIYDNASRLSMDSINLTGTLLTVGESVVPVGSTEVYAVVLELNAGFSQDISVVKHTITGTIGILKISDSPTLNLYPNPAGNQLNIITDKAITKVEVLNLQGKIQLVAEGPEVDITLLESGIYFIKAFTADGISTQKFVKQ